MAKKKARAELSKREKFEKAGRFPILKVSIIAVVVIVVAVGGVMAYWLSTRAPEVGGPVVEQGGAEYSATAPVSMTLLSNVPVEGGAVKIPVAEVKAKKLVAVLYKRATPMPEGYNDIDGNGLPLLAYVAPSGRLVVASSLCEPCHSYEFHIEGNELVCNACFTRWDLNTLEGKEGGCQAYPPAELKSVVQGDTIDIPTDILESWVPRV